jgi:PAS domain S-box-containing protein
MEPLPGMSFDVLPRIIVVDDDEDTRLNLRDILELDGYQVEDAGSARELLSREQWDVVSLVLLDRRLPDGTPQQILPGIRKRAPHVAVIIVTGYADIEGAISALRSGAADYILKPVSADALRASVRRVLERQQAEREIARLNGIVARSEERYRSLFESTLDGLLILDDAGTIVAANPAACIQAGFEAGALDGKNIGSLMIATSETSRPAAWSDFLGQGNGTGECTFARENAAAVDIEYRSSTNFAPGLHLLSFRDVTSRNRAEERARQAGRLAAIGETMAALVHESRNALQRSKACLEMLSLEVEDRPEALKLVARAQRAQEDLHRLYEEVRQWAAPLHLRRESCSLRDIWKEVWCLVNQAHRSHGGRLEEEITCDSTCHVDRFAISQVFRNIFENAVDASPAGAPVRVRCWSHSNGNGEEICVAISDQGPGLSSEQERRIFEPFFTTKAKGTGLGMAIVQRIIQSHGGTIMASSPRGAEIEIRLPRGAI